MQEKPQLLRNFIQRRHDGPTDDSEDLVDGVLPENLLVERVIAQKPTVHGQLYLTKWRGLAYSETTWESEADLKDSTVRHHWHVLATWCTSQGIIYSSI